MTAPDPTPHPLDHLALRGAPDAPALTVGDVTLSYAELDDAVGRNAAALLAHGLAPGDRIASWMGKTMLACVLPLAAARAGLVHVPINPVLRRAQAAHILADSGARLLIANAARLDGLEPGDMGQAKAIALEGWIAPAPGLPLGMPPGLPPSPVVTLIGPPPAPRRGRGRGRAPAATSPAAPPCAGPRSPAPRPTAPGPW